MSVPDESVSRWLRKQLADITGRGTITRIELWHVVDGDQGEKCDTWSTTDIDPDELAQLVWDVAENDVSTRHSGEPNRYVVQAYRGEDDIEPERCHPFEMVGRSRHHLYLGNDTEAPTDKGERAQHMRMLENLHRQVVQMTDSMTGRLTVELESERKRRERAEGKLFEQFETMQELFDRKQERELERAREEAKERRHEKVLGMLLSVGHSVASQWMISKNMPPALQAALQKGGLQELLHNLDEEEFTGAVGALKPHNQMAFLQLYQAVREQWAKEQKELHPKLRDPDAPKDGEPPEEETVRH